MPRRNDDESPGQLSCVFVHPGITRQLSRLRVKHSSPRLGQGAIPLWVNPKPAAHQPTKHLSPGRPPVLADADQHYTSHWVNWNKKKNRSWTSPRPGQHPGCRPCFWNRHFHSRPLNPRVNAHPPVHAWLLRTLRNPCFWSSKSRPAPGSRHPTSPLAPALQHSGGVPAGPQVLIPFVRISGKILSPQGSLSQPHSAFMS